MQDPDTSHVTGREARFKRKPETTVTRLTPLGDRVLVLMDAEPEVVRGVIVSAGKPAPQNHGRVIAVGSRVTECAPGDRVLWTRWHSEEVEVGGVMHRVMKVDEIIAVLT